MGKTRPADSPDTADSCFETSQDGTLYGTAHETGSSRDDWGDRSYERTLDANAYDSYDYFGIHALGHSGTLTATGTWGYWHDGTDTFHLRDVADSGGETYEPSDSYTELHSGSHGSDGPPYFVPVNKETNSANVADDVIAGDSPEGGLLPDVRYRVERPLRASWTGPGWDRIVVEVSSPSAFLGLRDMRADEPFAPLLVFAGYWRGGVEGAGRGELPAPMPGPRGLPGPEGEDPPSPAPTEWFPMPRAGFAPSGSVPGGRAIEVPSGRPVPRPYVLNANTGLAFQRWPVGAARPVPQPGPVGRGGPVPAAKHRRERVRRRQE